MELYRRITNPDVKVDYLHPPGGVPLTQSILSFMKRLLRRKSSTRLGAGGNAEARTRFYATTPCSYVLR